MLHEEYSMSATKIHQRNPIYQKGDYKRNFNKADIADNSSFKKLLHNEEKKNAYEIRARSKALLERKKMVSPPNLEKKGYLDSARGPDSIDRKYKTSMYDKTLCSNRPSENVEVEFDTPRPNSSMKRLQLPNSPTFIGRSFSASENIQRLLDSFQDTASRTRPPWNMTTKVDLMPTVRYKYKAKIPKSSCTYTTNTRQVWKNEFQFNIRTKIFQSDQIKTTYATRLSSKTVENSDSSPKLRISEIQSKFAFEQKIGDFFDMTKDFSSFSPKSKGLDRFNISRMSGTSEFFKNRPPDYPLFILSVTEAGSESNLEKFESHTIEDIGSITCKLESSTDIEESLDNLSDSILTSTWGTSPKIRTPKRNNDIEQNTTFISQSTVNSSETDLVLESPAQRERRSFFKVIQRRLRKMF